MVEYRAMVAAVAAVAVFVVGVCAAGTVTVRASASVEGNVVRLSDVATLEGAEAERLADVVVVEDLRAAMGSSGVVRLEISRVRRAIEDGGARVGRVALQGAACEVRAGGSRADVKEPGAKRDGGGGEAPRALPGNVRGAVEEMLGRVYSVSADALRVTYDARDWDFLGQDVTGRRVEAQPGGSATGTKQGVRVWVYEGDRVALEGQVTACVEVRREVVVMTRGVRRGELIGEHDVRMEERWVEGAIAASAARGADEVIGREARTRLGVGGVVRVGDAEAAQVIRRGDLVVVHCVSGGVVVKAPARALGDAREGEAVELKLDGSSRAFVARASGKGRAVMEIGSVLSVRDQKEAR